MPRPDKKIDAGPLDGPSSSSRAETWTKYGTAETADGRSSPSSVDEIVEITVEDITVTSQPDAPASKYTTRGTAAHGIGLPDEDLMGNKTAEPVREWVVDRIVEGRMYHRTDTLVTVYLDA